MAAIYSAVSSVSSILQPNVGSGGSGGGTIIPGQLVTVHQTGTTLVPPAGAKYAELNLISGGAAGVETVVQSTIGTITQGSGGDGIGGDIDLSADGTSMVISYRNTGIIRVFRYDGISVWAQVGPDMTGMGSVSFGAATRISSDGTIVVFGAENEGLVQVYKINGGETAWDQVGPDISGGLGEGFGHSIDMNPDGTTIAIGSHLYTGIAAGTGRVQVFKINGDETAWDQVGGDLVSDAPVGAGNMGIAVAISSDGTIVACGIRSFDVTEAGRVISFKYNGASWDAMGASIDGSAADDEFGVTVRLSADGLIVAATSVNHASDVGQSRIYEFDGANWVQLGSDIIGATANIRLGVSMDLSADGLTIGIGGNGGDGVLKAFKFDGAAWNQYGVDEVGTVGSVGYGASTAVNSSGSIMANGGPGPPFQTSYVDIYQFPMTGAGGNSGAEASAKLSIADNPTITFVVGGEGEDTTITSNTYVATIAGGTGVESGTSGGSGFFDGYGAGGLSTGGQGGSFRAVGGNGAPGAVVVKYS